MVWGRNLIVIDTGDLIKNADSGHGGGDFGDGGLCADQPVTGLIYLAVLGNTRIASGICCGRIPNVGSNCKHELLHGT